MQVTFRTTMPLVDIRDDIEPAWVMERTAEFGEPRHRTIGNAVERPDADFRVGLHAVLPAIGLLEADPEHAGHWFPGRYGAEFLCCFSIRPRRHNSVARLVIGDEHGRRCAIGLDV